MPLKVLLADDSMTAQNMGRKILSDAGYQVIAVSNGAQAMKKLASEKPDLVVLDVYMPGYTGLEVCERIKSTPESANTPVILCVAKMEPFRPEEGRRVKADAVIIKPFEATDLVARMQEMEEKLGRWRASQAEVEESVSRFQQPEAEPVEEEPTVRHIEVPEEMASAPAFGMDLEAESAQAAAQFTGELVVEHEREPVDISGGSHMVSADGLSGVFEMQQPAPVQSEVQEFAIAAPATEPEPEVDSHPASDTNVEPARALPDPAVERFASEQEQVEAPSATEAGSEFEIVAPPAVEDSVGGPSKPDFGLGGEVPEEHSPEPAASEAANMSVEAEAAAAAEVEPRPEFVVDRITVSLSEAPVDETEFAPVPPASVENVERVVDAVETAETPIATPEPLAEMQPGGAVAIAAEEENTTNFDASLHWVAEEVALDPGESATSLEEETKVLVPEASQKSQPAAEPVEFEISELDSGAAEESVTAQDEPAPAPQPPPDTVEQALVAPDVPPADAQVESPAHQWPSADSLRCEAEQVIEATPEPAIAAPVEGEASVSPEVTAEPSHQLASAMAAAIADSVAPANAPTDPNLVEQAVDRLLDRLKPDLVSQILRELNKK